MAGESKWWTLEDLYTAVSKKDLVNRLGEIKPDDPSNMAFMRISFCCEKAKRVVFDIIGASHNENDFTKDAPAIISECIVVLAAIYLSAESDRPDYKEMLQKRYEECKKTLIQLRDFRISPKRANGQRVSGISFGVNSKELS